MTKNLVSIVIPCYNMGRYILEALESISAQTYANWEILVVDDCGPKDGTEAIVIEFTKNNPTHRIEYIKHETNKGVSAARNTGIKHTKGNFIALLDPDDFWMPEHLEKAITTFGNHKELYFYSSFAYLFNENNPSSIIDIEGYKDWEMKSFPAIISIRNAIPNSSAVLRSEVFEKVGFYDENPDIQHVEDYDLWLRILSHKLEIYIHTEPTIYYRKHKYAATSNNLKMQNSRLTFAKKHKDWLVLYQREALERLNRKIFSLDDTIIDLREDISTLEKRVNIIEQTISKFKSLPVIKQFLNLKNKFNNS